MRPIPEYGLGAEKPKTRWRWLYLPFMVLLGLGSMALATQRIAAYFNYHPALGEPWGVALNMYWYAPWSFLQWEKTLGAADSYGFIDHALTQSQALFLLPQFIILGVWLAFLKKIKGTADLHGSAHWAKEDEISRMGYLQGKGVYVGGWLRKTVGVAALWCALMGRPTERHLYLRHNGPEHILVFAPTRSGKGVGLILPTLLSWEGSALVLDIKGENWAISSGWRKSQGQKCLRFEPTDASGTSAAFNPLAEIRLDSLLSIPDCQNLASMMIDGQGKGLDDHWSMAAFAMLSGALLHCCIMVKHSQDRTATLYDLCCMLADEARTIQDLFKEMVETDHVALLESIFGNAQDYGAKAHIFIASSAREMLNKAENEASGVVSTALTNLALYRDPVVNLNTSRCDFRIDDLMNHDDPVSLFLVISPADIDRLRPLLRLMIDMIIRRICAQMEFEGGTSKASYKHRLLMLLDEFTSLGKIQIVEKALAYMAGYGIKAYIIVQDISQLNAAYGKENSIMSNCHTRVAYAPNTIETAKILSDMTGKTTVLQEKVSLSGSRSGHLKNASVNMTETARPLLTPDETMRLPGPVKDSQGRVVKPGDMLVFTAGNATIYGRQILYFLDPTFSARSKIPAPGLSPEHPAGVSDSLYPQKPAAPLPAEAETEPQNQKGENFESYFQ